MDVFPKTSLVFLLLLANITFPSSARDVGLEQKSNNDNNTHKDFDLLFNGHLVIIKH